jgi:hypothetical protein
LAAFVGAFTSSRQLPTKHQRRSNIDGVPDTGIGDPTVLLVNTGEIIAADLTIHPRDTASTSSREQ